MATLNFPDNPTTGDVYTDSNSGFSYEWNGTVWISTDPSTASNIREIDDISGDFDDSETDFTLKVAAVNVEPVNAQQLIISLGGVMQNAGDDFTVSGSTITFTTAPQSGLSFFGTLLGTALSLNTIANGSVGSAALKTEDFTIGGSGNTVTIPGNLTVQGTETIINTERLDIQDKTVGIASTNAPSSTSQDDAGVIIYGQTDVNILYDVDKAALGISTAVNVAGVVTATEVNATVATVGSGVTINNTGIDAGNAGIVTAGTITAPADLIISAPNTGAAIRPRTDQFTVKNAANNETLFYADANSAFAAFYDNTKRFETASDDAGGGVIVTGKIVGTAATIGTGVTINNTGIDAGNAGIVTAGTVAAPSNMLFQTGGSESVRITSDGDVGIGTVGDGAGASGYRAHIKNDTYGVLKLETDLTGGDGAYLDLYHNSASPADDDNLGSIGFKGKNSADEETDYARISGYSGDVTDGTEDGYFTINTKSAGTMGERLRITSGGGFSFNNAQLIERVAIVAGKLSNNTNINLADGMVYYFSTTETTTSTPNIRIDSSNTLNNAMDTGDVITVTLITTAAAAAYSAALNIDGSSATVEWSGAAAPSAGGASGLDVHAYTIIKTGSGAYKVLGNYTNFD